MNGQVLIEASLAIKIHLATILGAVLLTGFILALPKGSALHKKLGWIWVLCMSMTCIASFFIHEINLFHGYSPIHLLSIWTIIMMYRGIRLARLHEVKSHKSAMLSIVIGGIVVAGLFTLMPGRLLYNVFFAP